MLTSLLPQNLQKRLLSYALRTAIGRFLILDDDGTNNNNDFLKNLDIQLSSGIISLDNVRLNLEYLQSLHKLPLNVDKGTIQRVSISVPWTNMFSKSVEVQVTGVCIAATVKCKYNSRFDNA